MNLIRRWTALKKGMGQHCHTRWLRPIRYALLILILILISALAGFLLSQPTLAVLLVRIEVLEARIKEVEGFLNGSIQMIDNETGYVYSVVKEERKLVVEGMVEE